MILKKALLKLKSIFKYIINLRISIYNKNIYSLYDKKKYNLYDKLNNCLIDDLQKKFSIVDIAENLVIPKNRYLIVERPEGSYIENKSFHISHLTIENKKNNWDDFWKDENIINEYMEEERKKFMDEITDVFIKKMKEGNIIDVGCGTGDIVYLLIKKLNINNKERIYGVDFSENSINYCKNRIDNATFSIEDIYNLNYKDNSFTNVICTEVIEHLIYPMKAIQEMYRICKPGGIVFITIPNSEYDNYFGHINFWTMDSFDIFLKDYKKELVLKENRRTIICTIYK